MLVAEGGPAGPPSVVVGEHCWHATIEIVDVTRACELCEAARFTEWYYEDDQCWVAECEACCVPMIVWKKHDPHPDDATKAKLHSRLLSVATSVFDYEPYIDDNMRNIPDHYHAHARGRGLGFGQTPKRRDLSH